MNFQEIISDELGKQIAAGPVWRDYIATAVIERLADEGYHIAKLYVPNFILVGYRHR